MNKKIITTILMILIILSIMPATFAAVSVKVPTSSTQRDAYMLTPSDAYAACMNMKNGSTSTLGNNNLDPHLMLNSDWSAMAYLGLSEYGSIINATGANNYNSFAMDNGSTINLITTTGNVTGVETTSVGCDDDRYRIYTSSILESADSGPAWRNLYNNRNTKYVEILPTDSNNTTGQAIGETSGWFNGTRLYVNNSEPILSRTKAVTGFYRSKGDAITYDSYNKYYAFRPVIWNK